MCSLAPRAAALGLGRATSSLDRRRGVAAVVAPASSGDKAAGETIHRARARARAAEVSTPRAAPKRGRDDGFHVDPASPSALRERMDAELVALQRLVKKAKVLPHCAPRAGKKNAPPQAQRKASPPSQPGTEAAYAPEKQKKQQQQQRPVRRTAASNDPVAKAEEAPKKRLLRPEEVLARAAAREEFRRMLIEMEKAALPDETIYTEDLEELGIAPYEHAVTRTRKQAWLEHHAKMTARHGVRTEALLAV